MSKTEVKGLTVDHCHCPAKPSDNGMPAWRVIHTRSGLAIPMPFLREKDAEAAMHAISGLADWTLSAEEILAVVDKEALERAMTEALAW